MRLLPTAIAATPLLIPLFLASAGLGSRAAEPRAVPNFVIIVLDDAGWNDIGAYGNPAVRTPNIDRLAAEGMRFENAFVTTSSCSPSRASLMTARYPHNTGAQALDSPLPAEAVIFPAILAGAGYYTAAAGKWHLGEPAAAKVGAIHVVRDDSGSVDWVKALARRPRGRPFMLWLSSLDPHRPFTAPAIHSPDEVVVPPFLADRPGTRRDLAAYYDELARVDQRIGEVLGQLSKQGVADETVVILLSDNGRPFPRCKTRLYDSGVKTPFIVRWPGRVRAGSVNPNLISSIDVAPTILELAGIESPADFQGRSFARSLFDPKVSIRDHVFLERNAHGAFAFERGIRSRDFLYIQNLLPDRDPCSLFWNSSSAAFQDLMELVESGAGTRAQLQCFAARRSLEELYDTRADPFSLHNLARNPAQADVLARMREALATWSRETRDEIDVKNCGGPGKVPCAYRSSLARRKRDLDEILAR